jgi:hypothetical protein
MKWFSRKFLYPLIYIGLSLLNNKYDLKLPMTETAGVITSFIIGESAIDLMGKRQAMNVEKIIVKKGSQVSVNALDFKTQQDAQGR